jgi:hypothetical protein
MVGRLPLVALFQNETQKKGFGQHRGMVTEA